MLYVVVLLMCRFLQLMQSAQDVGKLPLYPHRDVVTWNFLSSQFVTITIDITITIRGIHGSVVTHHGHPKAQGRGRNSHLAAGCQARCDDISAGKREGVRRGLEH